MPGAKKRSDARLDASPLLDQAAQALDGGDFDRAIALAEQVLEAHPKSAAARHLRAAGLLETGDFGGALDEYERALKLAPDDPQILLGMADLLICHPGEDRVLVEQGVALCERGRKRARKEGDRDLELELLILLGTGLNQLGDCARALKALDDALALAPGAQDAELEKGIALFELCRFAEAEALFQDLARRSPDEPWTHHYLGLLAERRKDAKEARRRFARARALAPEDFFEPVRLDDAAFDEAVEAAMQRLPSHVRGYLDNATIAVEPFPKEEDLTASLPPLSPCILGVFRGTPVGHRSVSNVWDHAPASIVLYQRNLERFARTREELVEQIGITVMHEVGHLIGLDEDDLWERGLD